MTSAAACLGRTMPRVAVFALAMPLCLACAHTSGPDKAQAASPATPDEPKPIRTDYPLPAAIDPAGVAVVAIDYVYTGFHDNHLTYRLSHGAGGRFRGAPGQAIDEADVATLVAAVTDLHPSDSEKECTTITDWYPQFRVVLSGAREVILETRSNCPGGAPWSVVVDGDLFIQYDGKLGPVVRALLARIDRSHWETFPDTPEAFTAMSDGRFLLTGFTDFVPKGTRRAAPSTAEVYARYLEASDAFRSRLAGAKVEDLDLYCDLSVDAQCSRVSGQVTLARRGEELRVPIGFDDRAVIKLGLAGGISVPTR